MNVLAIGCHPDDIEISCSGTLAKCVKRGDKVTVCHVANGNMGHEIISPEELRVIRANEAKKAGKKVLVIDKRPQIAGNIYTEEVEAAVIPGLWLATVEVNISMLLITRYITPKIAE